MSTYLQTCHVRSSGKNRAGFTLIELIVVVVIIGVLAAIAIPAYFSYINTAKITLAYGALDSIRKTLEGYHIDYQHYPESIDLTTWTDPNGHQVLDDMLIEQVKNDLTSFNSYNYNSATASYILKVTAKDGELTEMTMTPQDISY